MPLNFEKWAAKNSEPLDRTVIVEELPLVGVRADKLEDLIGVIQRFGAAHEDWEFHYSTKNEWLYRAATIRYSRQETKEEFEERMVETRAKYDNYYVKKLEAEAKAAKGTDAQPD